MSTTFKYANTAQLLAINTNAITRSLNRALSDEGINNLDINGFHVLMTTWLLDDGDTLRSEWLVKMRDQDMPAHIFIDATPGDPGAKIIEMLPLAHASDTEEE